MRKFIEDKLKQAQEQQAQWQQRIAQAQEQVVRWDAIRLFCGELLAEGEHEGMKGHEVNEADIAG